MIILCDVEKSTGEGVGRDVEPVVETLPAVSAKKASEGMIITISSIFKD